MSHKQLSLIASIVVTIYIAFSPLVLLSVAQDNESKYVLYVDSFPFRGVKISYFGDENGTGVTPFKIERDSPFNLTLKAPAEYITRELSFPFKYWTYDLFVSKNTTLTISVTEELKKRNVTAHFMGENYVFWNFLLEAQTFSVDREEPIKLSLMLMKKGQPPNLMIQIWRVENNTLPILQSDTSPYADFIVYSIEVNSSEISEYATWKEFLFPPLKPGKYAVVLFIKNFRGSFDAYYTWCKTASEIENSTSLFLSIKLPKEDRVWKEEAPKSMKVEYVSDITFKNLTEYKKIGWEKIPAIKPKRPTPQYEVFAIILILAIVTGLIAARHLLKTTYHKTR